MLVTMSNKELHRLTVIQAVIEKCLRRRDAASQLDLSGRQVQRLILVRRPRTKMLPSGLC